MATLHLARCSRCHRTPSSSPLLPCPLNICTVHSTLARDPLPFRTTSSLAIDIPGADDISRRPRSHRAWRTLRNAVPSPRVARTQRTHSSVVRVLRFRHLVRNLPACPRICSTARSQELFCGESVPLFLGVGSGLCFQWAGTLHLNARS